VRPNPLGREFGFARRIQLNDAGRRHPMFGGKPAVFEALAVHRDDIAELPAGALVLASNDMGVQALELRHGPGVFWGVQYHPEFSFAEIAACAVRYDAKLIEDGLFADRAELESFIADLRALMHQPDDRRLAWKHGLGAAVQHESLQLTELRNWLEIQVLPHAARRAKDRP